MDTLYKILAAVVLMAGLTFGGAWGYQHIYSEGYDHGAEVQKQKDETEAFKKEKEATEKYNKVAQQLLDEKAKQKIVYRTITKEVEKIVDRPIYKNECIDDDGLSMINKALKGD